MTRSRERDGWENELKLSVLTNFEPVWKFLQSRPRLRRFTNHALIDSAVSTVPPRPNPLSTLAPYTSWSSLTDRTYSSRHLPPVTASGLPSDERVADLFTRSGDGTPCPKSTVLFAYFAQWFTDGFLRSDRHDLRDPRRNDSRHEIDLLPLYGVTPAWTEQLRAHEGGRLKSQQLGGAEFPPYLYDGGVKKPEFSAITVVRPDQIPPDRLDTLFAAGSDTTNSQVGFTLLNTLFLREHNRVAGALADAHPGWDDERLFQTARNILIVLLIKLVIEEYINHITPYHFHLQADPAPFKHETWLRPNWMAIEFNLLYRWHGLIPPTLHGEPVWKTIFNPAMVVERGVAPLIDDASHHRANRVGVFNTDPALRAVELASIREARAVGLAPYNDYRALASFPRVTDFDQITGDEATQSALKDLYGHVDRIEFFPGLFAEDARPNSVLPSLIGRMVGVDAFSQALTNPLLSLRVFNEQTFSPLGMEIIGGTRRLSDIVHRNVPEAPGEYDDATGLAARLTEYTSLADVYEFLTPEPLLQPEGNVAAFAPWLPEPPARVLDCACGIGLLAAGLARAGYETHASDLSPEMVRRTRALGVDARVCGWDDLPPTGDFDAVLCVGNSLTHARGRRAALAAMAGALRPGGALVLTSRNWERETALGTRLEVADELVERSGRRALITRAWTVGEPTRLEVAVSLLDPLHTVSEVLTVWPFTADELEDDLRGAGLEPEQSTYSRETERYLVTASRP